MKAVQLLAYGGTDQLVFRDVPDPQPGPGEVLVRVWATSINPIDWKLRSGEMRGRWPLQLPTILGRDVAGEVVGSERRVLGLIDGGYAELLTAREDELADWPDGLAPEQAAALPLVLLTGAQLIEKAMGVTMGQTILVTGALGSVGRTAVFVAKQAGATVLAGVRGRQKDEAAELNADAVVAVDSDEEVQGLSPLDGVGDTVGGRVIEKLMPKIKPGGVLGSVLGPPPGVDKFSFRVAAMMAKPDGLRLAELARAVLTGQLLIPVAKTFPLAETGQAQQLAEQGGAGGKIVVVVPR